MAIKAVDHNVNIIALEKNGRRYAMCCAWVTQVAADKLIAAIGPQSATGKVIAKGDTLGFSNLTSEQKHIAFQIGDLNTHSDTADKLAGIAIHTDGGAIFVDGARAEAKCAVLDVLHLPGIEAKNIVYMQIESGKENGGSSLHISDLGM